MTNEIRFEGEWGGGWSYDPSSPLGEGGFGKVFAGVDLRSGDPVAVKVIERNVYVPERLQRREREIAEKLRSGSGEYQIAVRDVAQLESNVLIVMERADKSLHAFAHQKIIDEEAAISILSDIAAGLRELHQAGIVHRDLKPSNVLLHQGTWKVADFGIARDVELGTQTFTFLGRGTYEYMAPETWRGESPSPKTDLYALGVLGYELLMKRLPFTGPDEDSFRRQHLGDPPPAMSEVSARVERLILRLLAKHQADRPQDARTVEEALAGLVGKLDASQERLATLAGELARDRAATEAREATQGALADRFDQLKRQGASDLEALFGDAADDLRAVLPEITWKWQGSRIRISAPEVELSAIVSGLEVQPGSSGLLAVGEVFAKNFRHPDEERLANIALEAHDDRADWFLYRVRVQGVVDTYVLGPVDRWHGIGLADFVKHVEEIQSAATGLWVVDRRELTVGLIKELFTESAALR